jgi:periplasmic copper chaperone A
MLRVLALFCCLVAMGAPVSEAHQVKHGGLVISHPWVRALPPGPTVTAGYLRIHNTGAEPDWLISATAEFAQSGMLHQDSVNAEGIMQMRPLTDGIEIPAGATIELKPGGAHLMFNGVKKALQLDVYHSGTLVFKRAGPLTVEFFVEPVSAKDASHP